ncbi:hypothetical protein [Massilia sp. CT11-137]
MTDYHVITPASAELVMQVVDGQIVIVPPENAPQTPETANSAGHKKQSEQ